MTFSKLSVQTREGLCRYTAEVHGDERLAEQFGNSPESWAWFAIQLRAAPDRIDWFPRGKWATIQAIEGYLTVEAYRMLKKLRGGAA